MDYINIKEIKRNLSWYRDELYNQLAIIVKENGGRMYFECSGYILWEYKPTKLFFHKEKLAVGFEEPDGHDNWTVATNLGVEDLVKIYDVVAASE